MMITTIMGPLKCHLPPEAVAGAPDVVVTPTRPTTMAMKITTIIMVTTTITTGVATMTRTTATMISRCPLEAVGGVVEPEVGRLRCVAEGLALHGAGRASRSVAVSDRERAEAHGEEPEAGFCREGAGYVVLGVDAVEM